MTAQPVDPDENAKMVEAQQWLKTHSWQDIVAMNEYIAGLEARIEQLENELKDAGGKSITVQMEPPAHAWAKFTHPGEREELSFGTKGQTMEETMDAFFAGVDYAYEVHGVVPISASSVAPQRSEATAEPKDEPSSGKAQGRPRPPKADEVEVGKVSSFVCYQLKINPQAKNTQVLFFTNAYRDPIDEYAYMTAYNTPEKFAEIFKALSPSWMAEHFTKPYDAVLEKPFIVHWRKSLKTNMKGTHYMDLIRLEKIE